MEELYEIYAIARVPVFLLYAITNYLYYLIGRMNQEVINAYNIISYSDSMWIRYTIWKQL